MPTTNWGIKHRLLLLALTPAIIISILLGGYFTSIRLDEITKALHDRGSVIVNRIANSGESGLFARDKALLLKLARHALTDEIISVAFYDKNGGEIASAGMLNEDITPPMNAGNNVIASVNPENDTFVFLAPITLPELVINSKIKALKDEQAKATIIGWAAIELEQKNTRIKEYQVLLHSILIVVLGLAASTLLALRLGRKVANPILDMIEAVKKLERGDLSTRIKTNTKWELASLESGINNMAHALQDMQSKMQSNIDKATRDVRKTLKTIEIQNVELNIARKAAENATSVKSEFLASMSHELRTPLNGILGFIKLLEKTVLNDSQKDYLDTIDKSATSLLAIINDILDFSKIEAGKLNLNLINMDIRECVEDALNLLAPHAHSKALEVIPFIYSDVPHTIIADPLRVKQVIINLVSNAIKFTEKGNVVVRVMVDDENGDDVTIKISVTDTGIGMSEQQQEGLFSAFNQTDPNITRRFGGTGLGLVICKKLIEQMHGEINLESRINEGSTFWFTLKAQKALAADRCELKFSGHNILIYEQHQASFLSIKHLLSTWDLNSNLASSEEQLDKIFMKYQNTKQEFKMFLLSINQSTEETKKFISRIVDKYSMTDIQIGVLINSTDVHIHQDILSLGVDLCLAKPIAKNKLFNALDQILNPKNINHKKNNVSIKQRILAVDDNKANLKLVTAFLENLGARVTQASSGEDAVILSNEQKFDLIFMDLHMPGLNGIESTARIKVEANPNHTTPVVALTANVLFNEKQQIIESGFNDYLTKPIDEAGLQACIYKWTHSGTREKREILTPIDWNMSLNLANGKVDLAKDMLHMLLDGFKEDIINIKDSYTKRDLKQLSEHVHRLHGACCYVGVPNLKENAKKLEEAINTGAAEKIHGLYSQLLDEIDNVLRYYNINLKEIILTVAV